MTQHLIKIEANNQPTALEALLRVVRFRGFRVDGVAMHATPRLATMDIEIVVRSDRPVAALRNQLAKLVDIQRVQVDVGSPVAVALVGSSN